MSKITLDHAEFEKLLVKDFPKLYKDMQGDPRSTCMAFGIDTGPGWFDLIYNLSSMLSRLAKLEKVATTAVQVKEKFGTLRFYLTNETASMAYIISCVAQLSAHICETCGQKGELGEAGGWFSVRCEKCRNKKGTK